MAAVTEASIPGLNLEKELVCFICTEVLYQPLCLIDCLHSFCGSCLKEWFSYQYKKAAQSRSSQISNPYTCPTCRATVKDARHNATINTLLEMFLAANPDRGKSAEEKEEIANAYKPGEDILKKLDASRRHGDRRSRRAEEAAEQAERWQIEQARERSLREMRGRGSDQESAGLAAPDTSREDGRSRSRESRDRDARRERRREQDRQDRRRRTEATEAIHAGGSNGGLTENHANASSSRLSPPTTSSPRHPEAVEARMNRGVSHQASLRSLVSASESGTGTGDSLNEARIMEEIINEGLLEGINLNDLDPAQEDELSERIAQAYRQRHQRRGQDSPRQIPRTASSEAQDSTATITIDQPQPPSAERRHYRHRSASSQSAAVTEARQILDTTESRPPPVSRPHLLEARDSINAPSESSAHMRRSSDQNRRRTSPDPQIGRPVSDQSGPNQATRSVTDLSRPAHTPAAPQHDRVRLLSDTRRRSTEPVQTPSISEVWRNVVAEGTPQGSQVSQMQPSLPSQTNEIMPGLDDRSAEPRTRNPPAITETQSRPSPRHAPATTPMTSRPSPRHDHSLPTRTRTQFPEPSISCAKCSRQNIQYELHKHCSRCDMDLCLVCYRASRGCDHWFGFGRAAQYKFEASHPSGRSSQLIELPHILVGRKYLPPPDESIRDVTASGGNSGGPLMSMSDPDSRLQEGKFCDRCHSFANQCFWSCDYCNEGEWGFCNKCVNIHHCCTHPLLPLSHQSFAPTSESSQAAHAYDPRRGSITLTPSELHASIVPAPPRDRPLTPEPTATDGTIPETEYLHLRFTTNCDICTDPIQPYESRYHCPSHPTPSPHDAGNEGDYDICRSCYMNLVKHGKVKSADGPSGWRKCPSGHRMIVAEFDDHISHMEGERRIVINDLVGGHKLTSEDIAAFATSLAASKTGPSDTLPSASGKWTWRENSDGTRTSRARSLTLNAQASKFPPDGGYGKRCVGIWSYYPEEGEGGKGELLFPRGAEVREVEDINEEWYFGVYAGEKGLFPAQYVRILDS